MHTNDTLEEFLEAFEEQIATNKICDGNYLGNRSYDEILKEMSGNFTPVLLPAGQEPPNRNLKGNLDKKIQEWKDHVGDTLLFFAVRNEAAFTVSIIKAWKTELDNVFQQYALLERRIGSSSNMPCVKPR